MIIRLSQKLNDKLQIGPVTPIPLDDNPYIDWSAHLFTSARDPYVLLSNTSSLYSTLFSAKGIESEYQFIEATIRSIESALDADGLAFFFGRFIAPYCEQGLFAKALNRSVTGSINELVRCAKGQLVDLKKSLDETRVALNETPMSILGDRGYDQPRDSFRQLADVFNREGV